MQCLYMKIELWTYMSFSGGHSSPCPSRNSGRCSNPHNLPLYSSAIVHTVFYQSRWGHCFFPPAFRVRWSWDPADAVSASASAPVPAVTHRKHRHRRRSKNHHSQPPSFLNFFIYKIRGKSDVYRTHLFIFYWGGGNVCFLLYFVLNFDRKLKN